MRRPFIALLAGFGGAILVLSSACIAAETFITPLFNCPSTIDAKSLSACASANQEKLSLQKPSTPYAHTDGATIYKLLGTLPQGQSAENEPIATRRLRSSIGEWLYFSTPEFLSDDGKPPASYEDLCADCMNALQIYERADGRYLVFFWNYLAASNANSPAYLLDASGKLTPLMMQEYVTKKRLTQQPAHFSDPHFDPATGILSESASISCCMTSTSTYKLNGELFELQKLTQTKTSDTATEKTTTLYERKNNAQTH